MKHSLKDQLLYEIKSAAYGYPDFVFKNVNQTKIPVFVYHTIEPDLFESHLQYLQSNGYTALSIEEYLKEFRSKNPNKEKHVLVTIDDARSSVWRYAYPLLKKYKMKAVVFIIPGLTPDAESNRLNYDSVLNGTANKSNIYNLDPADETLCSWSEITTMYSSGLIDIELHTLFHRENFISNQLTGFIPPMKNILPYNFKGSPYFPLFRNDIYNAENYGGLPLFQSKALMLPDSNLKLTPEFILKCKSIYDERNGSDKWKEEIKELVKESNKKYLTVELSSESEIRNDLIEARQLIQKRLNVKAGNHLCLPWTLGNNESIRIIKELGIRSCFWGSVPEGIKEQIDKDEYYVSRIKNDFVFRLPGKERKSLVRIYNQKMIRRLKGKKVF